MSVDRKTRNWVGLVAGLLVVDLLILGGFVARAQADAMPRMKIDKLKATHADVEKLAEQRKPVETQSGFDDVRASMHVHSHFSHDSRSSLDEVVAGAKEAGVRVIMFNEHPADTYDYFKDGHRGMKDGVLLIPGAETGGFLAFPTRSLKDEKTSSPQSFAELVTKDDGLIFLSHLEERMDWDIAKLTGTEIYNTHADVKDEPALYAAIRQPMKMMGMLPMMQQFPQEWFASLLDYPADYLRRFDELCQLRRQTAVAANDAHHNQGIRAIVTEDNKIEIIDRLDEKVAVLDPEKNALVKGLMNKKGPGDVVMEFDLDPYPRSLKHVSTHMLLSEFTEKGVKDALKAGRTYVAFDWIGDPSGFVFQAMNGDKSYPLGSEVPFGEGLTFKVEAPLPGFWRLIRNGEEVSTGEGRTFEYSIDKPGIYRIEIWQTLAEERRPWILSGPIYVRES